MTTRRQLLAAAAGGTVALAGCSGPFGDDSPEYDDEALAAIPGDDVPRIERRVPAGVAADHVAESEMRARELLDAVPQSIPHEEVPNEAVRGRIERTHDRAEDRLEWATEINGTFEALYRRRRTRYIAAEVEAMYDAARGERSLESVGGRRRAVRDDLESFEDEYTYEGDDPVETLVTAATVEQLLATADRFLQRSEAADEATEHETVAEAASRVESAVTRLEDARHVYERFENQQNDTREFTETFEAAAADLYTDLEERCGAYDREDARDPTGLVEADIADTPAESLLERLAYDAVTDCDRVLTGDENPLARHLLDAHRTRHYLEALRDAEERIEAGAFRTPADAAEVEAHRERAIEALGSAVPESSYPWLTDRRLRRLGTRIERGDSDLQSGLGPDRAVVTYGYVTVLAAATPAANGWLVDALE